MNTSLKLYPKSCFQNAVYKNLVLEYKSIQFIETLLKLPFYFVISAKMKSESDICLKKKKYIYIYIHVEIYIICDLF